MDKIYPALRCLDERYVEENLARIALPIGPEEVKAILFYLDNSRNMANVSGLVSHLSFMRLENDRLLESIVALALGDERDPGEDARLASIYALPRLNGLRREVLDTLRIAYKSPNVFVRNAALVTAQRLQGIAESEIRWPAADEDISDEVPEIVTWLDHSGTKH